MKRRSFKVEKAGLSPYHKYNKTPFKYSWSSKKDRSDAPKAEKEGRKHA